MKKILLAILAIMILVFCVSTASAAVTLKTNIDDENPVFGSDSQDASNPDAKESDDEEVYDEGQFVLQNDETNSIDVVDISYTYDYDFDEDELNITEVEVPTGITNGTDGTLKLKARIPKDLDSVNEDDEDDDYLENRAILVADAVLTLSDDSEITVPLYMQRENMLKLDKIDIDVGSDSYDEDDNKFSEDVIVDETIEISVTLKNIYDEADDDVDMDDVDIEIEIDDDDDFTIDEDSSIKIYSEEEETLKATITMDQENIKSKSYELTIFIEAEDEHGAKHGIKKKYDFDVDRKTYDFVIDNAELYYDEVSCSRENEIDIKIESRGEREDDEVSVYVENRELGIDFKKEDLKLEEYDRDDNSYSKVLHFTVPEDLAAGTYPITVKVFYSGDKNDGVHADEKDVTLTVNDCVSQSSDTAADDTSTPDNVEVGEDGQIEVTVPDEVMQEFGITETVEDSEGFTDSVGFVVLLIVLVTAVLGAEAALIIWLVKRPKA